VGYIPVHVRDYSSVIYGREGDTWKDQDGVRVKVSARKSISWPDTRSWDNG
jgi:hypothetical protein